MSDYAKVFWELKYEVWKVSFLNAFLDGALAFFVVNILFTLARVSVLYSLIPAAIVFIVSFFLATRKYTLRRIEEGNPEVAEILRTAHDNSSKDELMVHALFLELIQKMETVTAGVFIDGRKTTLKLLIIALLAFAPLLLTQYTPHLKVANPLTILPGLTGGATAKQQALAPVGPIDDAGNRDIYGNKDVLQLGNEKLDITAASGSGGVDLSQTQDASGNSFKYNDYPTDVQAQQTTAGTGGNAGADSGIINDYSCKVKGTCAK